MTRDLGVALGLLFILSIILVVTVKLAVFGFIGMMFVLLSLLVIIIDEFENK